MRLILSFDTLENPVENLLKHITASHEWHNTTPKFLCCCMYQLSGSGPFEAVGAIIEICSFGWNEKSIMPATTHTEREKNTMFICYIRKWRYELSFRRMMYHAVFMWSVYSPFLFVDLIKNFVLHNVEKMFQFISFHCTQKSFGLVWKRYELLFEI